MGDKPVLWHLPVSHYNEKVRWALDYKHVEHERHTPPPPSHMAVALWLTRGTSNTFPVLQLDGQAYGDSTEIIAALERRFPEPALYPSDPDERRRALEVEEFFDEQVAPPMRLLVWHEAIKDREAFGQYAIGVLPAPMQRARARVAGQIGTTFLKLRYDVGNPDAAARARSRIEAGFDRIEAELGDGEYLVGDEFSVADLTAASIMYPFVLPPEGPQVMIDYPPQLEAYRLSFSDRPAYEWVGQTFQRHRKRATAPTPA